MLLPARELVCQSNPEDPLPYYFQPVIGALYRQRLQLALTLLGDGPFDALLDIGYGSGILFREFARRAKNLAGADVHPQLNPVRDMLSHYGLTADLRTASVLALPFPDAAFDAVVCISVLEFITDLDRAVAEMARVARPGAILVVGMPVTNRLMSLGYRLIGISDQDDKHVSSEQDILAACGRRATCEALRVFPGVVPRPLALFMAARFRLPAAGRRA